MPFATLIKLKTVCARYLSMVMVRVKLYLYFRDRAKPTNIYSKQFMEQSLCTQAFGILAF